jgi:putative sterol carrier protein
MAIFQSDQQLYDVLHGVFEAVTATPANIESFTQSNLVIRMQTQNPEAEVLLDGRQPPLEVFYGPRPGKANLEVVMEADLLHAIWTGAQSASEAFFSGRIRTKGNLLKAMQLLDLFRECEAVYPAIAAQHGLPA